MRKGNTGLFGANILRRIVKSASSHGCEYLGPNLQIAFNLKKASFRLEKLRIGVIHKRVGHFDLSEDGETRGLRDWEEGGCGGDRVF
jgi:hypothetical protein